MAKNTVERLGKRIKSLNRSLNNLDIEERELVNQGLHFKVHFKDIRQSIRKIIAGIETKINIEEKGE